MLRGGYDPAIVRAIGNLLSNTTVKYNGHVIPTERGCPQGSCISPDLWAIGMADLCRDLLNITSNESREKAVPCCFADDILLFAHDRSQLTKAWRIIQEWSEQNKVPINLS